MPLTEFVAALILGLVEGATEFLPVSSTGHLILVADWLGFQGDRATTFEVVIQLGAILAIVWLYRERFIRVLGGLPSDPAAVRFTRNLLVAFLPAALVGLVFHDAIKTYLFSPVVVAWALVIGGVVMLAIERLHPPARIDDTDAMPVRTALGVGLAQVLSLIPGTSRAGATIMGGYVLGLSRRAATEFSFFLAVPVMVAASGLDLFKARNLLTAADVPLFATGFITAFVSALVVVKGFLRFVSHRSFAVFAWYRIVFGGLLLWRYLTHPAGA